MSSAIPALSPPKQFYKGGRPNNVSPGTRRSGPTKDYSQRPNKKVSKANSRKPRHRGPPYRKQANNVSPVPKQNMLLHRLSPPSPSSLLERIGGSAEDEVASTLTDQHRIDMGGMSEFADNYTDLPFSPGAPHSYTPEPDEVVRFLESVIGSPSPPGPVHACLGEKSTLALETHNFPVDYLATAPVSSSSVLYSPPQTAVNSLSSASHTLDYYQQNPLLDDTMPPLSPSTIEECRKHLVPVLLASAQARDPATRLDAEQCHRLLSDDHCKDFFRQAKEMRRQISSLVSQKTPVNQGWNASLKRDRIDDVDPWIRSTRSRFDSVNTVVSDVSRRDSDITLVDFPGGRLPPKAPRAMLQASRAKSLNGVQGGAPYNALAASPTIEGHPPSLISLADLVHQVVKMFPALASTNEPVTEMDRLNAPVGTSMEAVSPRASPSASTDFVSHLPTEPGIWFRQQGREHAEIVDVDIDVSDHMFYMSRESVPFRLRMYLRLCSLPVTVATEDNGGDVPEASLQAIDGVIGCHALHWPRKGKLVIQVNPESERSKTWLPYTLESDPLDVTSCMRPGKNTFRFIQLSDLSEFSFVLAASPPPPEEEWRSWDWTSLVRPRPSSTDDPADDLSAFAHIPVSVRS